MTPATDQPPGPAAAEEIEALYRALLQAWNNRQAGEFAGLFDEESAVIGFDGSLMTGAAEIERTLARIFADHVTAAYIAKVREVRFLAPRAALLRAVVGMLPPGGGDLNPAVNTHQTLVAVNRAGRWRIALFQNTPAQFHGRPDLARQLTDELRALLPG